MSGDNKRQPGPILGQIPRLPRPARLPAADGDAIEARDAEIERLRRWKAEATEVIARWDAVADLVPARFGYRRSAAVAAEIEQLRALADQLAEAFNDVFALLPPDRVRLIRPTSHIAIAAYRTARTNGSASATDVGVQP